MKDKHMYDYSSDDDDGSTRDGRRPVCPWLWRLRRFDDDYGSVDEMRKPLYFIVDDVSSEQVRDFENSKKNYTCSTEKNVVSDDSTTRQSLSTMCVRTIPFRFQRGLPRRRRHDSETASLTRVESMVTADHLKEIQEVLPREKPSQKEGQPMRKRTRSFKLNLGRLPRLRLQSLTALSCRKHQKHEEESSTTSAEDMKVSVGDDPSSILGVLFPHPVFVFKSQLDEKSEEDKLRERYKEYFEIPVQKSTNKLALSNTIVQTMAADSWGSEASSHPSDEQSFDGTSDFDIDDIPFDEVDAHSSFDVNSIAATDCGARRLIEIGDTDRGVHYFYSDETSNDSIPWIERLESTGTTEFHPGTLCNAMDVNSFFRKMDDIRMNYV